MEKEKNNKQVLEEMRLNQFSDRQEKFWDKYKDASGAIPMPVPEQSPEPKDGEWWGKWRFNAKVLTLEYYENGHWVYEVDLEKCADSAQMLDWIFQVNHKGLGKEVIADLIQALNDLLHPQRCMCSFGTSKTVDVKKILQDRT